MNKKGFLDDIVDSLAAFGLLVIIILLSGLLYQAHEYEDDFRYEWEMKKFVLEESLIHFLRGTTSSGTSIAELMQDQDASSQVLLRKEIKDYYSEYFGGNPWRVVVEYPSGKELEVDEATGPSTTVAENYVPGPQGPIKIYLQTGDITDELRSGFITWFINSVVKP